MTSPLGPLVDPDERRQQIERFLRERAERSALWMAARASAARALAHKLERREARERPFLPRTQERGLEQQLEESLVRRGRHR